MSDGKWIEVEGDKPKVERSRKHFAAIFAGLKTAEQYARELTLRAEVAEERAERAEGQAARLREALERIAALARPWITDKTAQGYVFEGVVAIVAEVEASRPSAAADKDGT